jgi:hypothetical protein
VAHFVTLEAFDVRFVVWFWTTPAIIIFGSGLFVAFHFLFVFITLSLTTLAGCMPNPATVFVATFDHWSLLDWFWLSK